MPFGDQVTADLLTCCYIRFHFEGRDLLDVHFLNALQAEKVAIQLFGHEFKLTELLEVPQLIDQLVPELIKHAYF